MISAKLGFGSKMNSPHIRKVIAAGMIGNALEALAGFVERVTFHNAENGFYVLRTKARGHRDLVTVVGLSQHGTVTMAF
jgi:hypothetical protein